MQKRMILFLAMLFLPIFSHPAFAAPTVTVFVDGLFLYGGYGAGLAVDQNDNLYIAENDWTRKVFVSKVTPNGIKTDFVPPGVLGNVTGLAFDASGNLYVADGSSQPLSYGKKNKVWKVSPEGTITVTPQSELDFQAA